MASCRLRIAIAINAISMGRVATSLRRRGPCQSSRWCRRSGQPRLLTMLRLTLLGPFTVAIDGHAITQWPRKSAMQLLQLLAIAPEHCLTRNEVAQALARDSGEEQLRQVSDALYALRGRSANADSASRLGDYIGASADTIWLETKRCQIEIDLAQFEQAASDALNAGARTRLPLLEAAIARCNGPLLAGLSSVVEPVVAPIRLHVEQLYLGCARAAVDEYMQRGQSDCVIVALQNVLRIVPSDEESHRQLIELYATLGRYHEAEQQLLLCRTVLARDLGLKPSAATIESIRLARERRLAGQQPAATSAGVTAAADTATAGTVPRYAPPRPMVRLIGREASIAEIAALLRAPDAPALLTLCGIGGIGKTQLALEVAHRIARDRMHGAAVVDLTRVPDAPAVARAVAMTLGLKRTDGRSWQERLQQHLVPLDLLLVLDNFEHVHRAAPWLASLIEQSPTLTVLCTSRFPLLLRGEQVFDVDPLITQFSSANVNASDVAAVASDAAALFLRAARSQRAQCVDAARDLPLIEEVCWRLDGLPLAIELAAARAGVVGVRSLLTELSTHHVALVNPMRDAPPRHTSLQELLKSTCAILNDDCKIGLAYAAHFEAGFTLAQFADSGLFDTVNSERVLGQLLEARVVAVDVARTADAPHEATPRFRLLETMRSYARYSDWMDDANRQRITVAFIAGWHRFAMRVSSSRHTPQERDCFQEFEREFENLAGAIRLAARVNRPAARELIAFLWAPCVRRGHIYDLVAWIEDEHLLRDISGAKPDELALLVAACEVYRAAARYPLAQRCGEMALANVRLPGADAVAIHLSLAYAYLIQSEWETGTVHAREAFAAALAARDERGELDTRILLTTLEHRAGHYPEARTHGTVARDICVRRHIDMPIRLIGNLALSLRFAGDFGGAIALYASAAERCRVEREGRAEAIMTLDQAECELLALDLPRANESLQRAEALVSTHRMTILQCVLHQQRGIYHLLRGEPRAGVEALNLSMEAMPAGSHFEQADITLVWLANACLAIGDMQSAVKAAMRLTSAETKVRRYLEPFVVDTVASVLSVKNAAAAATLRGAAARLRGRDGLTLSPAEEKLLDDAVTRHPPAAPVSPVQMTDQLSALPGSLMTHCHDALVAALDTADIPVINI